MGEVIAGVEVHDLGEQGPGLIGSQRQASENVERVESKMRFEGVLLDAGQVDVPDEIVTVGAECFDGPPKTTPDCIDNVAGTVGELIQEISVAWAWSSAARTAAAARWGRIPAEIVGAHDKAQ